MQPLKSSQTQTDRRRQTQTDGNTHRHRSSNSSLDCFSTIRTLGTFYILRKDIWNAGFSENQKILVTLFANAIFVCNVPILKKNRP